MRTLLFRYDLSCRNLCIGLMIFIAFVLNGYYSWQSSGNVISFALPGGFGLVVGLAVSDLPSLFFRRKQPLFDLLPNEAIKWRVSAILLERSPGASRIKTVYGVLFVSNMRLVFQPRQSHAASRVVSVHLTSIRSIEHAFRCFPMEQWLRINHSEGSTTYDVRDPIYLREEIERLWDLMGR